DEAAGDVRHDTAWIGWGTIGSAAAGVLRADGEPNVYCGTAPDFGLCLRLLIDNGPVRLIRFAARGRSRTEGCGPQHCLCAVRGRSRQVGHNACWDSWLQSFTWRLGLDFGSLPQRFSWSCRTDGLLLPVGIVVRSRCGCAYRMAQNQHNRAGNRE